MIREFTFTNVIKDDNDTTIELSFDYRYGRVDKPPFVYIALCQK